MCIYYNIIDGEVTRETTFSCHILLLCEREDYLAGIVFLLACHVGLYHWMCSAEHDHTHSMLTKAVYLTRRDLLFDIQASIRTTHAAARILSTYVTVYKANFTSI